MSRTKATPSRRPAESLAAPISTATRRPSARTISDSNLEGLHLPLMEFDRQQRRPADAVGAQSLARAADQLEECLVRVGDAALVVAKRDAHDVPVDDALEADLAFAHGRVVVRQPANELMDAGAPDHAALPVAQRRDARAE
jgi:hypothetical protein